jgi:ethanolamine utilization protein EutQ (cupin superfamily)
MVQWSSTWNTFFWYITVDTITVFPDGRLTVRFRDGVDVEISAEIWRKA